MPKKNRKHKKRFIFLICLIVVIAVVSLALLITNCFIPVKYLSSYLTIPDGNESGEMRVSFIDVGYGDCTIIEFPDGKTLVIDGGDGTYSSNLKVFKALNNRGINTIDYLVCSSVSAERCGGLSDIIKYKKVLSVYAPYCPFTYVTQEYRSFSIALQNSGLEAETLEYGTGVFNDEDEYAFCVLSPSAIALEGGEIDNFISDPTEANINDASAVVWVEFKGQNFLLLGNAGASVLDKLVQKAELGFEINGRTVNISTCKVVKIPCHGANVSHFNELLELTSPQCAVLSVGNNAKGCPSAFTISDAQNAVGEYFYRTDENGTVTITVRDGKLYIEKEKR